MIGEQKDVYVVNIYKMIVYKHFQYDIEGCVGCTFNNKQLIICGKKFTISIVTTDQKGKVYVWRDDSEASPLKSSNSGNMFELAAHSDDYESFSYVLNCVIGENED